MHNMQKICTNMQFLRTICKHMQKYSKIKTRPLLKVPPSSQSPALFSTPQTAPRAVGTPAPHPSRLCDRVAMSPRLRLRRTRRGRRHGALASLMCVTRITNVSD